MIKKLKISLRYNSSMSIGSSNQAGSTILHKSKMFSSSKDLDIKNSLNSSKIGSEHFEQVKIDDDNLQKTEIEKSTKIETPIKIPGLNLGAIA